MKSIFKSILANSLAIALTAAILPSVSYQHQLGTLVYAAIVLGVANTFIRPILTLILLPITVITLGVAGWFINALILLITSIIVPQFDILPWVFVLGDTTLTISLFWSYLITSFVLSFGINIMHGIIHDD